MTLMVNFCSESFLVKVFVRNICCFLCLLCYLYMGIIHQLLSAGDSSVASLFCDSVWLKTSRRNYCILIVFDFNSGLKLNSELNEIICVFSWKVSKWVISLVEFHIIAIVVIYYSASNIIHHVYPKTGQ